MRRGSAARGDLEPGVGTAPGRQAALQAAEEHVDREREGDRADGADEDLRRERRTFEDEEP